jgi:hypothetical protein
MISNVKMGEYSDGVKSGWPTPVDLVGGMCVTNMCYMCVTNMCYVCVTNMCYV